MEMLCVSLVLSLVVGSTRGMNFEMRDSVQVLMRPAQDFLAHPYDGSYIDQVQGKSFTCQPDIAIAVDVSSSVGRSGIEQSVTPIVNALLSDLKRLPRNPGDITFGSQVHLVTFTKHAKLYDIDTVGREVYAIKKDFVNALKNASVSGGSCISCALEVAGNALLENKRRDGTKMYIVLISDGYDHDAVNANVMTPVEKASENKIKGIFHFTVAIPGGKTIPYNEEALSLIADTPNTESFFRVTGTTSIAESAMYVVDMIAGAACLENLRDHI